MTCSTENECDPEHGVWVPVAAGGGWRGVFLATLLLTGYLSALHISLSLGWGPGESQPSHHSLRPCAGLLFHLRASSCLHRAVAEEPATTPVPACVWSGHQLGFPPLQHGGGGGEQGFLEDYSGVVWAIVAGQAANGLLMSELLNDGSGIPRLFVIFWSMLVNTLLSWVLLGLRFTPFFLLPTSMISLEA